MTNRAARAWCTSYRAAWVLPIAAPPLRDGAVVVEGDRIAWVGRAGDEPARLNATLVELGDAVLGPALVNAHTHLDLTVLRGLLHGLPFFEWIRAVVAARDVLTRDETLDSARAGVVEGFRAGIATFADTAPTDAPFTALHELGARGIAYLEAFGPDPAAAPAALAALRARVEASRARETPLVRVGVSPHAPYSVSDALYAAVAAYAREAGLPLATHVAEGEAESALVRDAAGPFAAFLRGRGIAVERRAASPVALLERTGVLGRGTLLIHCVRADASDVARIAAAGAAVATCPLSNRYFGHGAAPVDALRAAAVRVGVGTDSMASNDGMDLLAEARATGCGGLAECWAAASLGGARALGLDGAIGTLEVGRAADLAAFAAPGARESAAPPEDVAPAASLLVVAGAERVRNGGITADVSGISARARAAADRLHEWRARPAAR